MTLDLSKRFVTSFRGDIIPLHLGFDSDRHEELAKSDIVWSTDSDAVKLRTFSGDDPMSFNNGVLLILNKVGKATVTATLNETCYSCKITVTEQQIVRSDCEMNYYLGDLHNHTTRIHSHDEFITRTSEFQYQFIEQIKKEGLLDFCVMSDHAIVLNDTEYFRNFIETEKAEPNSVIIFPGAESEVNDIEKDRFGIIHKNSGEIVTFNTDGYIQTPYWDDFCSCINNSPEPIAIFAHPCAVGIGLKGIWNFCFHKNNTPQMLNSIRGIETVNGRSAPLNLMHEFNYSLALDNGFRVSPVASSDSHGPARGYSFMKAKTVILAPEKSREAFVDAMRHNRFYASESGNVKLKYSVNGKAAPADLEETSDYRFHVEISYFNDDQSAEIIECAVISDGGKTLLKMTDLDSVFDFEIHSDSARYFYLRFVDRAGCRTWSMPVWTGRNFDKFTQPSLMQIDLQSATAVDNFTGHDASAAIDGNVSNVWKAQSGKSSIVIDIKKAHSVCALGYYPRIVEKPSRLADPEAWAKWREEDHTSTLPTAFEIYTSLDGKDFEKKAEGIFRVFGGENIVLFDRTSARYVRLDILSTVGNDALPHLFGNSNCSIGNLTLFQ